MQSDGEERCHCGRKLHYRSDAEEEAVRELIAELGEKSLVPPGPILIGDSEKFCEVLTDTLVAIAARAVAAERERCLRIMREEVSAAKRAAIRRGER